MKRFILALVALSLTVALSLNSNADSMQWLGGVVTGNNSTDTTITRVGSIPGRSESLLIWSPDAECRIEITSNSQTVATTVNLLIPASNDMQEIKIGFVDQVKIYKPTTQRVGVFFLGN